MLLRLLIYFLLPGKQLAKAQKDTLLRHPNTVPGFFLQLLQPVVYRIFMDIQRGGHLLCLPVTLKIQTDSLHQLPPLLHRAGTQHPLQNITADGRRDAPGQKLQ